MAVIRAFAFTVRRKKEKKKLTDIRFYGRFFLRLGFGQKLTGRFSLIMDIWYFFRYWIFRLIPLSINFWYKSKATAGAVQW
jgi:hypothetical protein